MCRDCIWVLYDSNFVDQQAWCNERDRTWSCSAMGGDVYWEDVGHASSQ